MSADDMKKAAVLALCDGLTGPAQAISSARQLIQLADAVDPENMADDGWMGFHRVLCLANDLLEYAQEANEPGRNAGRFTDDSPERAPIDRLPPALPCPFCGSSDDIHITEVADEDPESGEHYRVTCGTCGVDAPGGPTLNDAAAEWNTRGKLREVQS